MEGTEYKMVKTQRHSVGIFSRDGEANYKWVINLLRSLMFHSLVEVVLPVYISNSSRGFVSGLCQSSFAIVYHTKKRGRLNVANVTDSLYDEELEEISRYLGRSNVVVLLDDLEDSSDPNMRRIIQEQRLDTYACKVILISQSEKESSNMSGADPRFSQSPISAHMQDPFNSLYDKLRTLKSTIEDAPRNNAGLDLMDNATSSSSSASSHRREGDDNSVVPSTISIRSQHHDDDSRRSSHQSGSGQNSRLITQTATIDMKDGDQRNLLNPNNHENRAGSRETPQNNSGGQAQRNRKKDKMVFGIVGGLIALLVIVLIIVLCVTL